eukprot:Clim_evm33s66 gene=Clim_evmTU33s66
MPQSKTPMNGRKKPAKARRVAVVCGPCKKAKHACSDERPCPRCIRLSCEDLCIDVEQKGPNRLKNRPRVTAPKRPPSPTSFTDANTTDFLKELDGFLNAPETVFSEDSIPVLFEKFLREEIVTTEEPIVQKPYDVSYDYYHRMMHGMMLRWKQQLQMNIKAGMRDIPKESAYFLVVMHVQGMSKLRGIAPELILKRRQELLKGFDILLDVMSPFLMENTILEDTKRIPTQSLVQDKKIYDNLPVGVLRWSASNILFKIIYVNRALEMALQAEPGEFLQEPFNWDMTFRHVMPTSWAMVPALFAEAIVQKQQSFKLRVPLLRKDGTPLECLVTMALDFNELGIPELGTMFITPVTDMAISLEHFLPGLGMGMDSKMPVL